MNPRAQIAKAVAVSMTLGALLSPGIGGAQQPQPTQAQRQPAQGSGIQRETKFQKILAGKWTGPRLADGQPDIQGYWSNTIANHNNFTDPQGGLIGQNNGQAAPREQRAPSRISDPADGQVPFQPWALAKVEEFRKHFSAPTEPQHVEPLARCAPAGVPKSFYWHGYEIAQYPGYVVFFFDSGTRVIHLDGKPHLPENVKLWNGDSRGHWEGNTLVVDVTNTNGKALFGRSGEFASENAKFSERYVFANDGARYNYEAVVTDPAVYTRPFTITVPARKYTAKDAHNGWHFDVRFVSRPGHASGEPLIEHDERICVENNGGFGNVAAVPR